MSKRTPRSNFFLILILGALTTVSPLSIDLYLAAFPQLAADLHTSVARIALSLSSYFVGLAAGQLFYGPLLDRFGRKPPLYFGLSIFIIASLGCIFSHTVEELIVFRFFQAIGGCAAQVAAMAMVRDFFPVKEGAKVFSLLMLILSVSPLLAPTFGGFIAMHFGWQSVFLFLLLVVAVLILTIYIFLPEGHEADHSISLKPLPIARAFRAIFLQPQFFTYAVSGSLSFSGLFTYVAGSPIIFMQEFHVSTGVYGAIFAFLSVGFIGAGQINIFLSRKFRAEQIYHVALYVQVALALFFFLGTAAGALGLYSTITMLFLYMSTMGFLYPNAAALALAPFSKNAGSAAALLGFLQMSAGALASTGVGLFNASGVLPVVAIFLGTGLLALVIFLMGKRKQLPLVEPAEDPVML